MSNTEQIKTEVEEQAAPGYTDEQVEVMNADRAAEAEADQQQTVYVGFEQALNLYNPDWKAALPTATIDVLRSFYIAGVTDMKVFQSVAINRMAESLKHFNTNLQGSLDIMSNGENWLRSNLVSGDPIAEGEATEIVVTPEASPSVQETAAVHIKLSDNTDNVSLTTADAVGVKPMVEPFDDGKPAKKTKAVPRAKPKVKTTSSKKSGGFLD